MRLTSFATEHLAAEVAAFPIASEASLEGAVASLDVGGDPGAKDLWRAAEGYLLRRFPGVSLDELIHVRDQFWGMAPDQRIVTALPLALDGAPELLRNAAEPAGPFSSGSRRLFARWLSLSLPRDLLFSAPPGEAPVRRDEMLSLPVDQWLRDQGFAEVHVHFGAGFRFEDLWVGAIRAVAYPGSRPHDSPGAPLDEGRSLGPWLLRAAVARLVLAAFLGRSPQPAVAPAETRFRNFLRDGLGSGAMSRHRHDVLGAVAELVRGRLNGSSEASLRLAYRLMGLIREQEEAAEYPTIQASDPLMVLGFGLGTDGVTPEVDLLRRAFAYVGSCSRAGRPDRLFELVLLQEIRVRCILYRHLVQRPMNAGLQWFIRHYARIGPTRPWKDTVAMQGTLEASGCGRGLRAVELRTAPPSDASDLKRLVFAASKLALDAPDVNRPELGLVLHFPKRRGEEFERGTPRLAWEESNADPAARNANPSGFRYQSYYNGIRRMAVAIARTLCDDPRALLLIRGVDVCTDELGVPTWVFVPIFEMVRAASDRALEALRSDGNRHARPLRATAHCGEDWVHLLGGLRRVDEAIRYLGLGEGDRLGHAMALGIDPEEWARRTFCVWLPKEERLLDLVWEWSAYAEDASLCANVGRLTFVEEQIRRLSDEILGQVKEAADLARVVRDLHSSEVLLGLGFPNGPTSRAIPRPRAVYDFLTNSSVFRRGRQVERFETESEAAALRTLQSWLRRKVGRLGMTVEVNPSSNLLIGDLSDLRRHPIWRLNPIRPIDGIPPVAVAIGSDDPLTFATTLREEYQLLVDCLVRSGESEESAMRWLDGVREAGMRARFTLPLEALECENLREPRCQTPLPLPWQAL